MNNQSIDLVSISEAQLLHPEPALRDRAERTSIMRPPLELAPADDAGHMSADPPRRMGLLALVVWTVDELSSCATTIQQSMIDDMVQRPG